MDKIAFANQLRGIAALFVVISHFCGVYWGMRETVAAYTFSPVQEGANSIAFDLVTFQHFNFGPFGVALFFLISGFVIPFTLEKSTRPSFLLARLFRIYPTYVACLFVALITVWLSGQYWGKAFMWDAETIITNLLLVPGLFGKPSVDLVNWTLTIELGFYLVVAILAPFLKKGFTPAIFLFSLFSLLVNWSGYKFLYGLATQFMFIGYMFIGTFFWYAIKARISSRTLLVFSLIELGIFAFTWKHGPLIDQYPFVTLNYCYGFVVFSMLFFLRNRFRAVKLLDFAADISYPLYIIHSLIGYSIIKILMHHGLPFYLAGSTAFLIVCSIAYFIHRLIELPSTSFGKKLASGLTTQQNATMTPSVENPAS